MVKFTENNMKTLEKRYLLKDASGKTIETPDQLFDRVVNTVCRDNDENQELKSKILEMMHDLRFLPNTPTLMNVGTTNMLSACFVINIDDTLESIVHDAGWQQAYIHKSGGGVGMNFSKLRPKGDTISTTGGVTTGVMGFLPIFNELSESIRQGGKRDGANMGILSISHPEIESWITAKVDNNKFKNFNLSVLITDKFMEALERDEEWDLQFNGKIYKTVKAKYLFDLICDSAHKCGCPGVIFVDEVNRNNPLKDIMPIECTNPCVTDDTWIMTKEYPNQVKNLINESFNAIINGHSKDPLTKDEYRSRGFFKTGKKDVYLIETKEGFEIKLTEDHLILTGTAKSQKWKKVKELTPHDTLIINNHGINGKCLSWEGINYTEEEGYLIGMLVGDGHITKDNTYILATWGESNGVKNMRELSFKYYNKLPHRDDFKGWYIVDKKDNNEINILYHMKCTYLRQICSRLKINYYNKTITTEVEKCSSNFYKGFIRGLFDTDGTISLPNNKKGSYYISLSQSNLEFMKALQRMLLRLGIYSTIYKDRKKKRTSLLPDGKGGYKEYDIKEQFELQITSKSMSLFYNKIGFGDSDKMKKLESILDGYTRGMYKQNYIAAIKNLTYIGKEDVYDAIVEDSHMFDGNGFILHNCGEQPLFVGRYNNELVAESCNLGSLNLSKYCIPDPNHNGYYDFVIEQYIEDIHNAVEFLDLVIDANHYPFPFIDKGTKLTRKIGLGTTGLSECLIKLKMEYGSTQSIKFIEKIFEILQNESHKKSEELSKKKGCYPLYDTLDKQWNKNIKESEILLNLPARRNLFTTTIAPNGTTGRFMCGHPYSAGIEPPPAICMSSNIIDSKIEDGIHPLLIGMLKERMKYNPEFENFDLDSTIKKIKNYGKSIQHITEIPEDIRKLFKVAEEIDVEDHIKVQSTIQKYIDNAISKTINMKNAATIDDIKKAYLLAYKSHCKGVTIYRDKCKDHQVFESSKIESTIEPIEDLSPRPLILGSLSFTKKTSCNTLFINPTYLGNMDKSALESFISANGGCTAMRNGLAICISVYQRLLETIDPIIARKGLDIVMTHLQNIPCQVCIKQIEMEKHKENVKHPVDSISCPAAVANVMKFMLEHKIETLIDGNVLTNEMITKEKLIPSTKKKCPECGNTLLFKQEGCMNDSCPNCGWGGCN